MEKIKSKMTVAQAMAEGFVYAGQNTGDFERLVEIAELHPDDINSGSYFLATKEYNTPSTDAKSLLDLISNEIDGQWYDETRDDDSGIYEALKDLDLTELANIINTKLNKIWYRRLTDIQLINP